VDLIKVKNTKRTFHLADVYSKFKVGMPNVLCVGSRQANKSTILNNMLITTEFEVLDNEARKEACLFHDSVDVVFHSSDFQTGFNVFDFQGVAGEDMELIRTMVTSIPNTILLVVVNASCVAYMEELAKTIKDIGMPDESHWKDRILLVGAGGFKESLRKAKIKAFLEGFKQAYIPKDPNSDYIHLSDVA